MLRKELEWDRGNPKGLRLTKEKTDLLPKKGIAVLRLPQTHLPVAAVGADTEAVAVLLT